METTQLALIPFQDLGCWAGSGHLSVGRGGLEVLELPGASQPHSGPGPVRSEWATCLVSGSVQDSPGEAAKEPERAPEHCLATFAGGQHFFEYLLVVSLKKKRSGEDYEPTITYQFPKVRTAGGRGGDRGWGV